MKPGIHPEYKRTLITCACGRVTETRSTQDELHVEICSHCHPFFTGRQKLVDTAGRVERFMAKYGMGDEGKEMAEAAAVRAAESEKQELPDEFRETQRAAAEAGAASEAEAAEAGAEAATGGASEKTAIEEGEEARTGAES